MSNWVTCPACHLKHSARPDGICPRCKTSLAVPTEQTPELPAAITPQPAMAAAPVMAAEEPPPPPEPADLRREGSRQPHQGAPASTPARPVMRAAVPSGPPLDAGADLVYTHEPGLFAISLVLSIVFWLALLVGTFGMALIYTPFVFLMYLFTQSALIAYIKGNAIKITPRQFPDLYARIQACAARLEMAQVPDCYLLNGQGGFNAFATRFLGRNFVILFSDVVDAIEDRPSAVDFYVGHELAHLKRGHLVWRPVLLPASMLPLLGAAYHRACESTCDRHGAACCGDTQDAIAALTALAAGRSRWKNLSLDEYMAQTEASGGFWMSFNELVSDYPWLVKRVARVLAFRDGAAVALPARNPLAYLLAMFVPRAVGGAGGGAVISMMVVVAIIGIIAAIAIPSLLRARISANEAATIAELRTVAAAEITYARQRGETADLECLAGRPACRFPASPPLLTEVGSNAPRHGYRFQLYRQPGSTAFRYTAVPAEAGQTGFRFFCADDSGEVYAAAQPQDLGEGGRISCASSLTPVTR